jgi:hypothetical protein
LNFMISRIPSLNGVSLANQSQNATNGELGELS